jgi:inner membrane protein
VDPLCHTLVGLALARAGLARRTPLATTALVGGANLPDVDAAAYFVGGDLSLLVRRGWTHGLPAVLAWPLLLTGLLLAADRWRCRRGDRPPARPRALLGVAALGVATHPALDWLNTYGMRWLMPCDGRWFYGDALYIVDPWLWLLLGGALFLTRRGETWVRAGLALALVYVVAMLGMSHLGRAAAAAELARRGEGAEVVLVAPLPGQPFTWDVLARTPEVYRWGRLHLGPRPELQLTDGQLSRVENSALAQAALAQPEVRGLRAWGRFLWFQAEPLPDGWLVFLADARYVRRVGTDRSFGGALVRLPRK